VEAEMKLWFSIAPTAFKVTAFHGPTKFGWIDSYEPKPPHENYHLERLRPK
ncbi:unnamed protein product, partial [Acidithrix sp. C25]